MYSVSLFLTHGVVLLVSILQHFMPIVRRDAMHVQITSVYLSLVG